MSYKFSYTSLPINYFDNLNTIGGVACIETTITTSAPSAVVTNLVPGVWRVIANYNNLYFGSLSGATMAITLEAQDLNGNKINSVYSNLAPASTDTTNGPIFNPFTNGYVIYGGGVSSGTPFQVSGIFHINQNWQVYTEIQTMPGTLQSTSPSPSIEIIVVRIA